MIRSATKVLLPALVGGAAVLTLLAAPAAMAATPAAQAGAGTVAVDNAAAAPASSTTQPNPFAAGVQRVVDQVHEKYPNAYLVEGDGMSPSGPTHHIADVTSWRFVFNDTRDAAHPFVVFAQVDLPSWQATLSTTPSVWVGSLQLTKPAAMGPAQAADLLAGAGYHDAYQFVTYRQPIAGGFTQDPLFIFGDVGPTGYVGVDTVTGVVATIE